MTEIIEKRVKISVIVDDSQVSGATKDMKKQIRSVADASSAAEKDTTESTSKIGASFADLKKTIDKRVGGINSTIASIGRTFGRIAFYRTVRSIIKMFTQGLGEGFTNFINYSESAKASMDRFATASLYLKNSIAAALMPVLLKLIPVFEKIVDWIANACEWISKFWAYINGEGTYIRAKKVFTEWGDGADEATKKVEKLKRSILGFDQINALSDNSSSSVDKVKRSEPNVKDMFETVELTAADKLKLKEVVDKFKEIWDWVKAIGQVLAAWFVAKEVIGFFNMLSNLGFLGKGAAVVAIGALEFGLVYKGFKGWLNSGMKDFNSLMLAVFGAALGTTLLTVTLGATGFVIGVGIALVAGIKAYADYKYENSDLYKKLKELDTKTAEIVESIQGSVAQLDQRNDAMQNIFKDYEEALLILDKLYELTGKKDKSQSDLDLIAEKVNKLNGMGLGNIIGEFDLLTGSVTNTKEEAKKALDELMKLKVIGLAQSQLVDAVFTNSGLRRDRKNVKLNLEDAYNEVIKEIDNAVGMGVLGIQSANNLKERFANGEIKSENDLLTLQKIGLNWNPGLKAALNTYFEADRAFSEVNKQIERSNQEVKELYDLAYATPENLTFEINADGSYAFEVLDEATLKSEEVGKLAPEIKIDGNKDYFDRTKSEVFRDTEYMRSLHPTVKIDAENNVRQARNNVVSDINYLIGLKPAIIKIRAEAENVAGFAQNFMNALRYNMEGHSISFTAATGNPILVATPQVKASGGIVEDGLFYANHGEMVGKFSNGKTAVANNAQIVDGIAAGVERAMRNAGGMGGGNITIQIVDQNGNERGRTVVSEAEWRNRRAGTVVIPVGV